MKKILLICLSIFCLSCRHNATIAPEIPITPIFLDSIQVNYVIHIKSVDTTKVTNLVNGLGYAYTINGVWHRVVKYRYDGSFLPVYKGKMIRGQFYIPPDLTNVNFQSNLFLLSTTTGDTLINPHNVATIQVWSNNVLVVDKRPSGFDSTVWNYGRYDISSLTTLSY